MDRESGGAGSPVMRRAGIVILSGACCNPSLGSVDQQARQVIERAAAETGVEVDVTMQPMSAALYGAVPRDVVAQLKRDMQDGGLRMPVVIINGKGVSYGAPDAGRITTALRELGNSGEAEA